MDKTYLLFSKMRVHNANAASSAYTIGVPAMTAWTGFMYALERYVKKQRKLEKVEFTGIAVSYHECELQTYRLDVDRTHIIGYAKPPKLKGKKGEIQAASFIEEARCHMCVSLLIELEGVNGMNEKMLLNAVRERMPRMKAAGGDIWTKFDEKNLTVHYVRDEKSMYKVRARLMCGTILRERTDLIQPTEEHDALDCLMDIQRVVYKKFVEEQENSKKKVVRWESSKFIDKGWLVPITVGFCDLSGPTDKLEGQRDYDYEHHFVEPIVTVGEFRMPHRFNTLDEMMWRYDYDEVNGLYLCKQTVQ
ncbi:type I-F CRISPR-associated protein Csy2 [Selenomonas sp. AB3002]|uniref:type I-F CRISPR-associated protein Csy2 n=1 Tax=Selenomonas sp. AB3002 TaxID=1392502 RepID=UPI000497FB84